VSAFIDHWRWYAWKEPIGRSDLTNAPRIRLPSRLLLDAARQWLQVRDARHARPVSFRLAGMGTVLERLHPFAGSDGPYNPPYYNDQLASYGLCKVKDLLVYYIDAREGYQILSGYQS